MRVEEMKARAAGSPDSGPVKELILDNQLSPGAYVQPKRVKQDKSE